jgi:exonuclease SbcC
MDRRAAQRIGDHVMKIVRLTFSGVRSYPGTCEIDFTGKTLVGILGDTGAGKTSILEAITVALYGRGSFTDQVSQLRSDDCQALTVDLVFLVDGRQWRAHRVFHTTRGTQARLTDPDGKHTDGTRAVDAAVRTLLGIDYVTFKSSVLVPQGRFGDLLNARDAERARILKSLFGVDELQKVRQLADGAITRIKDLIGQVRQEDARLHDDPASQAQQDRGRYERAVLGADDLDSRLAELRRLQNGATQASQRAGRGAEAAAELSERRVTDHAVTTSSIRQARDSLQQLHDANTEAETAAEDNLMDLTAQQEAAAASGLAPSALAAAAQVLKEMPDRIRALAEGQAAHVQSLSELDEEEAALARRADELKETEDHAARLQGSAQDTDEEAAAAAEVLQTLTTAVRQAGEAAGTLAQRRTDQTATGNQLDALLQTPPDSDPDQAQAAVAQAQGLLDAIRRGEAAHTAGTGLGPGDCCSVCARPLPEGYQPPQPQDSVALTQAATVVKEASDVLRRAEQEHARYVHEVERLQQALQQHEQQVEEGATLLEAGLSAVREAGLLLASRTAHPEPAVLAKDLVATAGAALARVASGQPPTAAEREVLTDDLLQGARSRVVQLQEAAGACRSELARAEAALDTDRNSLEKDTRALGKARQQAERRGERLKNEQCSLLASLSAVPAPVRDALPEAPHLPTSEQLKTTAEAVRDEQNRQQTLADRLEELRSRKQALLMERGVLAERRQHEVTAPLHQLETALQRWSDSVATAALLVDEPELPALPSSSVGADLPAVEEYATALETVSTQLLAALEGLDVAARSAVTELLTRLSLHAQETTAAYPGTVMLQVTEKTDPLDPTLLDGLSSQAGTLRNEAEHALKASEQALSQIPHKDRITAALAAGEDQLAAWQVVSMHMTDGKFLGHLTDLRTRALLAQGSELLQQLSGGQLGFADNFDIVSLTNHTRRSSRTLSGGETFQASLALSLSLMEMHGRSGTRMESLFLDEGFGTLDAASLDSALQVLRTHVGSDTLLAVISHLRPVAETVNDVLWVRKDHRGSQARWLTGPERDSLARDDLHNLSELT